MAVRKRSRRNRTRRVVMTVCLMIAVCVASIGGTIAWLTDKTEQVTNTFSPSNIDLELEEAVPEDKQLDIVPGVTDAKEPKVTIDNDVDSYLFVKVDASWTNTVEGRAYDLDDFITYSFRDNGWTHGNGTDIPADVWYREVGANDTTKSWYLLTGNTANPNGCVTYKTTVTKQMMDDLETLGKDNYPKLSFKAYAIQKTGFADAKAAWTEISK